MGRQLWEILAVAAGIAAAWYGGKAFGLLILPGTPSTLTAWVVGGFLLLLVTARGLSMVGEALFGDGAAPSTSTPARRIRGWAAVVPLHLFVFVVWFIGYDWITSFFRPGWVRYQGTPRHVIEASGVLLVWFGVALWKWGDVVHALKGWLGRSGEFVRRVFRSSKAGQGGSARFAGLLAEWANVWKPGRILLGKSIYDPALRVGIDDNRHMLTIASSAAGKGRSALIPNLLSWPHSALVIDPKGTNAVVTAARRGKGGGRVEKGMGHKVYVLNPFGVHDGKPGMPAGVRFNPLAVIDPNARTVFEDIDMIAEALVVPGKGDAHWDDSAKGLLRGLIAHAVTMDSVGAHLGLVRDMLTQPGGPPVKSMMENSGAAGIAREVASQLLAASDREAASIVSTAIRHTDWLASPALREALSESDFDIFDMKRDPVTIYLVLPPEYLHTHARFLRLFVNLAVRVASKGGKGDQPILFMLDEFYSLGRLDSLAKAAANIRSYGVRLWPIVQNLSQLVELYGNNWHGFWANAGQVQIFSANDKATEEHAAHQLGMAMVYANVSGETVPVGRAMLRDPQELAREISRESGRQIVFREGSDPLLLHRLNYDEAFRRSEFNPDPDHKEAPSIFERVRSKFGGRAPEREEGAAARSSGASRTAARGKATGRSLLPVAVRSMFSGKDAGKEGRDER